MLLPDMDKNDLAECNKQFRLKKIEMEKLKQELKQNDEEYFQESLSIMTNIIELEAEAAVVKSQINRLKKSFDNFLIYRYYFIPKVKFK
jgi:hypothetical protein